ncbi:MAG TPA: cyclic nucleotide-binding domain-containing protein, partial [Epsilonproteobacteria bacterium]|nr:cyclic nucleotide-binding domain-containing protein [Campylobacterota bacterium]
MKTEILFEVLQQIQIFSSLQRDEMKTLESYSTLSTYQKGEYLFLQGDRSQHLMILIDGVVSIYKHDSKGNEVVIGYFNRYALLAEAATLRKTPL